jgi:hypothetical protein
MSAKVWFLHVTELIKALGVILMERQSQIANVLIANSIDMLDDVSFRAVKYSTDLVGWWLNCRGGYQLGGGEKSFNLRLLM